MAEVRPFRAMMYHAQNAEFAALCCPPYDIIPPARQEQLYRENPANAIHLELAPGDGAARYANAAATLKTWLSDGTLEIREQDAFYIYEEAFTVAGRDYSLRGVIARVTLEEFSKGIVLPHEETLSKAKQDRFDLMCATGCNFSQVYSMYIDDEHTITPQIDAMADRRPDIEFTYSDGVTHRLWIETDAAKCAALTDAFAGHSLFIADGHHRYETGLHYRDHLRETVGFADNADAIMMMLIDIDHPGLVVLPTHRVLFDLPEFSAEKTLAALSDTFSVQEIPAGEIESALAGQDTPAFAFYAENRAWMLRLRDFDAMEKAAPERSDAYRGLDVAVLHSLILEPCFGIDRENMAQGKNLRYTRDPGEAMAEVDSGAAQAAFIINPTRVRQIKDVAMAGDKMPQKSTYFYPKIITGLVFNHFGY
ncbi:MAG: DUF1015 domain-containing protein [Ruminococcaceae bacterium]|nr:DUF1015 domain-containing protein [Oscillospiraceae bacterium]